MTKSVSVTQKGFSLIEVLIALAVLSLFFLPVASVLIRSYASGTSTSLQNQAIFYAQEAMEAAYNYLANRWMEMEDGSYYPQVVDGMWMLTEGQETIGPFTRVIRVTTAKRDATTGSLSQTGQSDTETREVEVEVNWNYLTLPKRIILTSYYSRVGVIE